MGFLYSNRPMPAGHHHCFIAVPHRLFTNVSLAFAAAAQRSFRWITALIRDDSNFARSICSSQPGNYCPAALLMLRHAPSNSP
jgi:hypothetical protein